MPREKRETVKLRLTMIVFVLFLTIIILPVFVTQVMSSTSTNTLYAHAETTTIGGASYYLHKSSSADGPATTLSQSAAYTGRKLMGRWVYPLSGIVSIPASTWTVTYRAMRSASASFVVAHGDVNILIRKSDNTIRTTIATNVANSLTITLVNAWETLTGTYNWPGYTIVDQTDYLEVAYYIEVTTSQSSKSVRLLVDDSTLPVADQTKIENVIFTYPNQAPVASFVYTPAGPYAQETITFDASASYDPDGSIVSYQWDFGDGNITTVTTSIITHAYEDCGDYTVTLTVTDNEGLTGYISQTVTVINPCLLRIWADVGSYVGSHTDTWIHESWVVSDDVPAGGSVSFDLYIDAISNSDGKDPTYDVYLAVAVNDTAQVASITVGSTTITTFTYGQVTWPSVAGGGTLSRHGVYPTWYALAPFGDVASNHGYYTTPGAPYGPYYAFRAYIPVTITASSTMNAGFKVHFDAQGVLVEGSTCPRDRNMNSFSHDLTFKGAFYIPPQYLVTFSQTGLSSDASGPVVTVNGMPKTFENLPYSFWIAENSIVTYSYETTVSSTVSGKRFRLDSVTGPPSPITVTADTTVTGNYVVQYSMTFDQTGLDESALNTIVTVDGSGKTYGELPYSFWVDSGTVVQYAYNSIVSSSVPGKRFSLIDVSGPTSPITVTSVVTVTGNYKTQYQITVTASPNDAQGGMFKVTYIQCGTTYTDVQKTTPWTEWVDADTTVTVSEPQDEINVSPGTRYKFNIYYPSASVSMDQAQTIILVYKTQYLVSFTQTGSAVAPTVTYTADTDPTETVPFSVWVRAGSQIDYTYQDIVPGTPGIRYVFMGAAPASPQTVNGPLTITGNYKTQFYLTVNTNPSEVLTLNPAAVSGEGWYDSESTATVDAVQNVDKVSGQSRYDFRSWTGATPTGVGNKATVYMDGPKTATANYQLQYYLTVSSPYDSPTPISGWFDNEASITASVTSPWLDTGTRYVCTGWDGTGSIPPSGTGSSVTFTITQPSTITWKWKTQHYLTVRTDPSGIATIPGEGWYDYLTNVPLTAPSVGGFEFLNWDVDGTTKPGNPIQVPMDTPHTATAHYKRLPAIPVGGYSISLTQQTPVSHITVYMMLIALFGAALSLTKRKRK